MKENPFITADGARLEEIFVAAATQADMTLRRAYQTAFRCRP